MTFFNNNLFLLFAVLSIVFVFSFGFVVGSQQNSVGGAGITPTSLFYFLDGFEEKIRLTLTFGSRDEARLLAGFAKERVAETQEMLNRGDLNHSSLEVASSGFVSNISKISDNLKGVEKGAGSTSTLSYKISVEMKEAVGSLKSQLNWKIGNLKKKEKKLGEKFSRKIENGNFEEAEEIVSQLKNVLVDKEISSERLLFLTEKFGEALSYIEEHMTLEEKARRRLESLRNKERSLRDQLGFYEVDVPSGFFMTSKYRNILEKASSSLSKKQFSLALRRVTEAEKSLSALIELVGKGKDKRRFEREAELEIDRSETLFSMIKKFLDGREEGVPVDVANKFQRIISEAKAELGAENFLRALSLTRDAQSVLFERFDMKEIDGDLKKDFEEEISRFELKRKKLVLEAERKEVKVEDGFTNRFNSLLAESRSLVSDSNFRSALDRFSELNSLFFEEEERMNRDYFKTL